jgi:hypothetical protein
MIGKGWRAERAVAGALLLSVAGACATARPDFERRFETAAVTGRPHDAWMVLLGTRYGCDTVLVKANAPSWPPLVGLPELSPGEPGRRVQSGMSPCDLASLVTPEVVRAWHTPPGWREEWVYRASGGAPLSSVFLDGVSERELKVTTTAR